MKTLKTTFFDLQYFRGAEKKIHVSEELLYGITLTLVVVSILTSGFIFTLAF